MGVKFLLNRFSRRSFLAGLGAAAALPVLAACEPQIIEVEKIQVVEREVPVERVVTQIIREEVERVVTVQVDRPVEVERVITVQVEKAVQVEVEKVITVQVEVERRVEVEVEKIVEVEKVVEVERVVAAPPVLPKDRDQIIMRSLALRSEGDPWQDQADEWNASQSKSFVKSITGSPSGGWTEWLGTRFASGNPPDLFFMSVSGLYANRAGELPLVIDVAPYMTPEQRADAELGLESCVVYGKQTVWPAMLDTGESVNINQTIFDEAGVDWRQIQKDGWNYEDFREIGQTVSEPEGQFMFGNALHWFFANCIENFGSAGVPLDSHGWGWYWGNKVGWEKPGFNAKLKMYQAMMIEDKSIPELVLGLPESASGHELFYNQDVAATHGYAGQAAAMRDWNFKIDKGEVTGKRIDWEMAPLPIQHLEGHQATNILRANGLGLFRQSPYQGDEHTENVGEFLQWLMAPERLKVECDFQGWLPPYASLRPESKALSDPVLRPWMEYTLEHAACFFAVGHPMSSKIGLDLLVPMFGRILQGSDVDTELADMAVESQSLLDNWVGKNPELAKLWIDPPSDAWPECYYTSGSAAAG